MIQGFGPRFPYVAQKEYVGRGRSEEGYAGERVQGLYTFGVRWAWKGHEHEHEADDGSIMSQFC